MKMNLGKVAAAVIPTLGIGFAAAQADIASQSHALIGAPFHQDGKPDGTIQAITFDGANAQATLHVADTTGAVRDVVLKQDTQVVASSPAPAPVTVEAATPAALEPPARSTLTEAPPISLQPDARLKKLVGAEVSDERGRDLGKVTSVSVATTTTGAQVFARVEPGPGLDAQIIALGTPDHVAALVNTPLRDGGQPIEVVVHRRNNDTDILTPKSKG